MHHSNETTQLQLGPRPRATRNVHPTLFTLLLACLLIGSVLPAPASFRREFIAFQSVCAVVRMEASSGLSKRLNADELERDLAQTISEYFKSRGLTYPVERGSACYPLKVSKTSKQLSLVFHVTITDELLPNATAGATIAHSTYAEDVNGPHDYPTKLFSCGSGTQMRECVAASFQRYFAEIFVPLLDTGKANPGAQK